MTALLQSTLFLASIRLVTTVLAVAAVWAIALLIKRNKGAAANRAWFLMVVALAFNASAEIIQLVKVFADVGDLYFWLPVFRVFGLLFTLGAALDWLRLLKKMTK